MERPRHGGHLVAQVLKGEGVEHLFTLSGGHIAAIYDGCVAEGIRIVDFRHEQSAAHAADAWARITLSPGVRWSSDERSARPCKRGMPSVSRYPGDVQTISASGF